MNLEEIDVEHFRTCNVVMQWQDMLPHVGSGNHV